MFHHHLAHFDSIVVSEGQHIKHGQLIGYVGNTGASTAPHLHYEVTKKKPVTWTKYTQGMTKVQVAEVYTDPDRYIDKAKHIPAKFDRFTGYGWLDKISANHFHPGVDINSGSDGWADLREPVLSPVNGVIVFRGWDGTSKGWGNHLWIEEADETNTIDMDFAKGLARKKLGFYIQVEEHGELWVVDEQGEREYIHPDNFMDWLRRNAVGISNADLAKVPIKNA